MPCLSTRRYNPHRQIVGFTVHTCTCVGGRAAAPLEVMATFWDLYTVHCRSRSRQPPISRGKRGGRPLLPPSPSEPGWTHGCGTMARGCYSPGIMYRKPGMDGMDATGGMGAMACIKGNGKRETGNGRQSMRNIGSVSANVDVDHTMAPVGVGDLSLRSAPQSAPRFSDLGLRPLRRSDGFLFETSSDERATARRRAGLEYSTEVPFFFT